MVFYVHGLEDSTALGWQFIPHRSTQIQYNPYQISAFFSAEIGHSIYIWKCMIWRETTVCVYRERNVKDPNGQDNLKEQIWKTNTFQFKIYYKATRIQTMCYQHDRDRSMEKNRESKNNSYLWSIHFWWRYQGNDMRKL